MSDTFLYLTSEVPHPVYGFTAAFWKKCPQVRELLCRHFGMEFIRGSASMESRRSRLSTLLKEKGP